MENILGYYIMPHPPLIIPEIGRGEEKSIEKTIDACLKIGKEVSEVEPETIVIITPHGPLFNDAIAISYEDIIKGDLKEFRAPSIKLTKKIDVLLTDEIINVATNENIQIIKVNTNVLKQYNRDFKLDHGTIVPLYFINKFYKTYKLVHITYGLLSDIDLYKFGMCINKAIENTGKKCVIIASGDLSHRLSVDGPYSYSPEGIEFDNAIVTFLGQGKILDIFKISKKVINEVCECGLNSIYTLLGTIGNREFNGNVLSYEGPFGVGYGVIKLEPTKKTKDYLQEIINEKNKIINNKILNSDSYVNLARSSIKHYLNNDEELEIPEDLPEEMLNKKAGVFVSLKKFGNLRGCIGTFLPTTDCIAREIIRNAVEAAISDPRFESINEQELDDLDISVDVLTEPIKANITELNPKIYGIVVSQGYKRGLLLPDLDGVDTIKKQL